MVVNTNMEAYGWGGNGPVAAAEKEGCSKVRSNGRRRGGQGGAVDNYGQFGLTAMGAHRRPPDGATIKLMGHQGCGPCSPSF